MADTSLLEDALRETVPLNKARGNFLAKFLVALLQVKTVNLSEIANVFAGRAKADRRVADRAETAQGEEAWTPVQECLSVWVGSFATHFMQPSEPRSTGCV